ncbi:MAG: polyphenol oxidase family protein [Candidatus Vogelbacteria bacterium]|nr:polyphenol oxidase family protein [Candidatus Vogelbacteria bacterium]
MSELKIDLPLMRVEIFLPDENVSEGIIIPKLCHGSKIVTVETGEEDLQDCDGLVTENKELTLGIRTADCAPVCMSDGEKIAIVHVGWRGLCGSIIEEALKNFEVTPSVYVGPFLHSFDIQKDFCYDQIRRKFLGLYLEDKTDKMIFDFRAAVASLLPDDSVLDQRNNATELMFPSFRRNKTKDRFVTAISFSK